jgi:hypothetical protein
VHPFLRTESGIIFDITGCQPATYNKDGINLHGVLKNAKQVTPEYIADLLTKGANLVFRKKTKKGRARAKSKSRFIVREEEIKN